MKRGSALRSVGREHAEEESREERKRELMPTEFGNIMSRLGSIERLFEDTFRRPFSGWTPFKDWGREYGTETRAVYNPVVDVYERGKEVVVRAELPGMKREDIDVKFIDENTISISGERRGEEKGEEGGYLWHESSYGAFKRTLSLPEGIEYDKADASYHDGVLEIKIPRSEKAVKSFSVPIH